MPELKKFRVSIYGILCQRGRVLVTETRGKKGTFLNFPGGAVDLGEAPLTALRREFDEETGLVIEPLRILHASTHFHRGVIKPTRQLLGIYWLVDQRGGELKNGNDDDVVAVRWLTISELSAGDGFTSFDREALGPVVAALKKASD